MVNELRNYGDGQTVVLYTNDNTTYRNLKNSTKLIKSVPYMQEQKGRYVNIGYDLYFDRKYKTWLKDRIQPQTP